MAMLNLTTLSQTAKVQTLTNTPTFAKHVIRTYSRIKRYVAFCVLYTY